MGNPGKFHYALLRIVFCTHTGWDGNPEGVIIEPRANGVLVNDIEQEVKSHVKKHYSKRQDAIQRERVSAHFKLYFIATLPQNPGVISPRTGGVNVNKPIYFKHDIEASNDPAIIKMRVKYGCAGYGLYWLIIEHLRKTHDGKSPLEDIPEIAYAIREQEAKLQDFITTCIEDFALFKSDGVYFWSNRLCRDMQNWNEIGEKRSAIGRIGAWKKNNPGKPIPQELAEACNNQEIELDGFNTLNNLQNQNQNQNQNNTTNKQFKKPSLKEVQEYCRERENGIDPQHFIDYQDSIGWKVGKKTMKDWKAAIRTWEHNNRNETQSRKITQDDIIKQGNFIELSLREEQ
jgi:hypothetical protein